MFSFSDWVSRIDIALDVADNTLFELDYFIKKLEALEFASKSRLTWFRRKTGLVILSVKLFTLK